MKDRQNDPRFNFEANPALDELIAQQGKGPVTGVRILHGDFWPEAEPIEDFLAALHEWRGHNRADRATPGDRKTKESGLNQRSSVLLNQIRSVARRRLVKRIGHASPETMQRVDRAIQVSLGLVRI